ncbi:MAG: sigma-54-dependent Fis family transcriptional regulator [Planctomycetes bacterium]|nr:sigma-54-dependent Fis family transcriptional regulator [Planctomycetota bacterium]
MSSVLVVDDDPDVLYSLEKSLRTDSLDVIAAKTGKECLELLGRQQPSAVVLDVRLPDMSGLDVFDRIRQIDPRLPVVVITAFARTDTAIEAMKRGAFEYLIKPVDLHQLRDVVGEAVELSRLRHVPAVFDGSPEQDTQADRIVGRSPAMQEVYKAIGRVAPIDVNVLILGESGTGKELVARAIFHHSHRSQAPFLAMNCAAIPESLLESELFGHERGAFTGADRRRIGKFEQANGGTLFMDEIGDMSLATQAKLLRLLQEQRFDRVGGNETIQTNVRVIAATNQNLEERAATGRFRQDLFYRLKVYTIQLPPLRERKEDLEPLVEHLLQLFCRELDKHVRSVSPETMALLQAHGWPGNVRELENTLKYAMIHSNGEVLTPSCLPVNFPTAAASLDAGAAPASPGESLDVANYVEGLLRAGQADIYRQVMSAVDRIVFEVVLGRVQGNQVVASELLGISRNTVRAQVARHDPPETNPLRF